METLMTLCAFVYLLLENSDEKLGLFRAKDWLKVWGAGADRVKRAPAAWNGAPVSSKSWCIYCDSSKPSSSCGSGTKLRFLLWKFTTDSTSSHFHARWATIEGTLSCQCWPDFPHWLIYYTHNLTRRANTVIIAIKILRNELPAQGNLPFRSFFRLF